MCDVWTALGYSIGASATKRKLVGQSTSSTWWAGFESELEEAVKQEINMKRVKTVRDTIDRKRREGW